MNQLLCEQTFLFCRDNEGCDLRAKAREETELAEARKTGLQFEDAGANNMEGLDPSLLDLFCNYYESSVSRRMTAALMESGYHGARLHRALDDLHASQYFRDLINDYRAHISCVGQE